MGQINGCDSTHTLNLTINYSSNAFDTVVHVIHIPLVVQHMILQVFIFIRFQNAAGCDSNIILALTINYTDTSWNGQSTFNTVQDSACDFYTWNGITYTTSVTSIGIGSHVLEYNTLTNPGCDSTALSKLIFRFNIIRYYNSFYMRGLLLDQYLWGYFI